MNLQFYMEKLKNSDVFKKFIKENKSAYLCSGFFSIDKVGGDNKQHFDFLVPQLTTSSTTSLPRPPNLNEINNQTLSLGVNEKFVNNDSFTYDTSQKVVNEKEFLDKNISVEKSAERDFEANNTSKLNGKIFSFQIEDNCKQVPIDLIDKRIPEKLSEELDFDFEVIEKMIVDKMQEEGIKNELQKILLSLQKLDGKDFLVGTIFISGMGIIKIKVDLKEMNLTEFEKKSFFDMVKVFKK